MLWMVPQFGARAAELIEARFMLAASFLDSRDAVAGTVYLLLLAVFAMMPALLRPVRKIG